MPKRQLIWITPSRPSKPPSPLTVRHITASYRELIKTKYASNPAELHRLNQICDETDKHEGDRRTEEYGPLALQRQRQRWIDTGNSRVYCNRLTNAIVRMFKFAVSQELVSNETWQKLKSVEPLRIGQTVAPETEPRKPVSSKWFAKPPSTFHPF